MGLEVPSRYGHAGRLCPGRTFGSLSQVAFAITGTKWNGPRFFGLRDRRSQTGQAARDYLRGEYLRAVDDAPEIDAEDALPVLVRAGTAPAFSV
jgi:DUF2924 family protein